MKNQRKTEYQGNEIYTDYNAGGWYCSVTDVVNFITDSTDVGIYFIREADGQTKHTYEKTN